MGTPKWLWNRRNPRGDGFTVRDVADYLRITCWPRMQKLLKRVGVELRPAASLPFSHRTYEPLTREEASRVIAEHRRAAGERLLRQMKRQEELKEAIERFTKQD